MFLRDKDFVILPWKADILWKETPIDRIAIVPGNEWELLTKESRKKIFKDFL